MRKLTIWSLIGSLWTVFYLSIVIIVTIPDFPYHTPLWLSLTTDPNGYWHELFYITAGYLAGMAWLMVYSFWYHLCEFLSALKRLP